MLLNDIIVGILNQVHRERLRKTKKGLWLTAILSTWRIRITPRTQKGLSANGWRIAEIRIRWFSQQSTPLVMGVQYNRENEPLQSSFTGNSAKSFNISVRDSLKKLRTDYIDILYVHWRAGRMVSRIEE